VKVDRETNCVGLPPDLAADLGKPSPVAASRTCEQDILDRIEPVHQLEVLMNHSDAMSYGISRTGKRAGLSVNGERSGVSRVKAGRNVHQGRLARAVLAQNGMYFAPFDIEARVIQSPEGAEALPDTGHFKG
jgi:hypothetical protein